MLDFTDSTGHLFNRLGAIIHAIGVVDTYQETTLSGAVSDVVAQFGSNPELTPKTQASLASSQSSAGQIKSDFSTIAQNTLASMVQDDSPQPNATLAYAIPELIAQMTASSATVKSNAVSASATAGTNTGTGVCLVSLVNGAGVTLENVYTETFEVVCIQDSQPGNGAAAGQEVFQAKGTPTASRLGFSWPGGSGGQTNITAASAAVDASAANILTNGDFESFTVANTPDGWTISTGTAGTTVFSTSTSYIGSKALLITGNGSELTNVTQSLRSVANAVAGNILPQTRYAIAFYLRVSAVPSSGVLRVALKDGVSGSVVGSGSTSVTLSGATTSYVLHSVTFSTPLTLPATLVFAVELTTALDSGKSVYVDELVMTQMVQHQNGPFIAIVPGSTAFVRGDSFAVAVSNDNGGKFQTAFNRLFSMDAMGLVLPSSSGSETISDSLIA